MVTIIRVRVRVGAMMSVSIVSSNGIVVVIGIGIVYFNGNPKARDFNINTLSMYHYCVNQNVVHRITTGGALSNPRQ